MCTVNHKFPLTVILSKSLKAEIMLYIKDTFLSTAVASVATISLLCALRSHNRPYMSNTKSIKSSSVIRLKSFGNALRAHLEGL